MDNEELHRRFIYHPPDGTTSTIHAEIRRLTVAFAERMNELLPGESREKSLFFTTLEMAAFWAHADIARNPRE